MKGPAGLKVIEYTKSLGTYQLEMIAMYNDTRIEDETVKELIQSGKVEHSDFVVVMYKTQYNNLHDFVSQQDELMEDLQMEQQEQM